ncbi:MAG TPA: class I SAM-dependent methyltransferase [Ktedonobacterales bacterium]
MVTDNWGDGASYERYVGRWSRLVARDFLAWLGAPTGQRWLDVGCGAGALTQTILAVAQPSAVTGVDRAEGFVAYARETTPDPRARFVVGDAQTLPVESGAYDMAVSGLALNFVPDAGRAAAEMARATRPGGTVAAYVWDYAGQMQFMRYFWDAVVAVDPESRMLDEGARFPLCQPDALESLFTATGLHGVSTRAIDIPTVFRDFDDYWSPFLGGQGSAPSYVTALSDERRTVLREHLRATLPTASDGTISLIARTWAVRGDR